MGRQCAVAIWMYAREMLSVVLADILDFAVTGKCQNNRPVRNLASKVAESSFFCKLDVNVAKQADYGTRAELSKAELSFLYKA